MHTVAVYNEALSPYFIERAATRFGSSCDATSSPTTESPIQVTGNPTSRGPTHCPTLSPATGAPQTQNPSRTPSTTSPATLQPTSDIGHADDHRGWYDFTGQGRCLDFCRWVGQGSGGDPASQTSVSGSRWDCQLAGT